MGHGATLWCGLATRLSAYAGSACDALVPCWPAGATAWMVGTYMLHSTSASASFLISHTAASLPSASHHLSLPPRRGAGAW